MIAPLETSYVIAPLEISYVIAPQISHEKRKMEVKALQALPRPELVCACPGPARAGPGGPGEYYNNP